MTWHQFLQGRQSEPKKVKNMSELLEQNQDRLLGHLLRADPSDPMRQSAITQTLTRPEHIKK